MMQGEEVRTAFHPLCQVERGGKGGKKDMKARLAVRNRKGKREKKKPSVRSPILIFLA